MPRLRALEQAPDPFPEYCRASDPVKAAQAQLEALKEPELAAKAGELFQAIASVYWRRRDAIMERSR
jgi:hypothetical protein